MSFHSRRARATSAKDVKQIWNSSFLDKSSIDDVKSLVSQAKDIDAKEFTRIARNTISLMCGHETQEGQTNNILANGIYHIIRSLVRNKVSVEDACQQLLTLGLDNEMCTSLEEEINKNKSLLMKSICLFPVTLPTITDVNWRVDVTISTTTLMGIFQPSVLMKITLTDGRIRTFECNLQNFHKLRYNVAKLLKNVQNLSQHPTITRQV